LGQLLSAAGIELPQILPHLETRVVTRKKGPVKIRGFCFTLVCDDGPERRGFRTG
jgi:hypothetical protein